MCIYSIVLSQNRVHPVKLLNIFISTKTKITSQRLISVIAQVCVIRFLCCSYVVRYFLMCSYSVCTDMTVVTAVIHQWIVLYSVNISSFRLSIKRRSYLTKMCETVLLDNTETILLGIIVMPQAQGNVLHWHCVHLGIAHRAERDVSLLGWGISVKLTANIHHVSGHCWKGVQCQRSKS